MDQDTTTKNNVNLEEQDNQNTATIVDKTYDNFSWSDIKNEKGKHAQAITSLYQDSKIIKDQIVQYKKELLKYKSELKKVNELVVGILVFVSVSFVIAIATLYFNEISDKTLYLKYDQQYQKYSEKNSRLKDIINQQRIDINNLKNEIKSLKK